MTEGELIIELVEALQDTRRLAAVSHEGDPWYASNEGIDAEAIFERARTALEIGEDYRARGPEALEDYDSPGTEEPPRSCGRDVCPPTSDCTVCR